MKTKLTTYERIKNEIKSKEYDGVVILEKEKLLDGYWLKFLQDNVEHEVLVDYVSVE